MEEGVVDVRGLSCPQPVLVTLEKIKSTKSNQLRVFVDTDTSKENISRMVKSVGWKVASIENHENGYILTLERV